MKRKLLICQIVLLFLGSNPADGQLAPEGELKLWHTLSLTFEGPEAAESDPVNPFTFYRMNVYFMHVKDTIVVPGFYAADGQAYESSASSGNRWRVYFNPPYTGEWNYIVSFRQGTDIAISDDSSAGTPYIPLNGSTGSFEISSSDKYGRDFRAKGLLEHHNEHFYRFRGDQSYFLKQGIGSPENYLAYFEFDNTQSQPGSDIKNLPDGLHHYEPHRKDWRPGNPSWQNGKGKGIIGVVNYLASEGLNNAYMLLMNVNGDGREVYPWTSYTERSRFDVSKLAQWELVFAYMQQQGVALHFVLQEAENDRLLNSGNLGLERRLYYREMIARFAHHNALFWNLGEENNRNTAQLKADAAFFKQHDPYRHPVKVHTKANSTSPDQIYDPLLGDTNFDATSLQQPHTVGHSIVLKWREKSKTAGFRWVIEHDEVNGGLSPDTPATGNNQNTMRRNLLWGNLTGGGGGADWYFGYDPSRPIGDLDCEDFRSRAVFWDYCRYALQFFHHYLPFYQMVPMDSLITPNTNNWLFGDHSSKIYLAFLSRGGNATVNLPAGNWRYRPYDPVTGSFISTVASLNSGLLQAPNNTDRAFLIFEAGSANMLPSVSVSFPADGSVIPSYIPSIPVKASATDADGVISKVEFYINDTLAATDLSAPYEYLLTSPANGFWNIRIVAYDDSLGTSADSIRIQIMDFPNELPVVSITSPADSNVYVTGSSIPINATASDVDGTIVSVELYINDVRIDSITAEPYSYTWTNVPEGEHIIKMIAYDGSAAYAKDSIRIIVETIINIPPVIEITQPHDSSVITAGDSIRISATAYDEDGVIDSIAFLINNTLVHTGYTDPYTFWWHNAQTGNYTLVAIAYDDSLATGTDTITFNVEERVNVPPTVEITQPANNSIYTEGDSIRITATADDADGIIDSVAFLINNTLVHTGYTDPYTFWWHNAQTGNYTLVAIAYDDSLATGTDTITFNVEERVNIPPTVEITQPANNSTYTEGDSIRITATADDNDGTIDSVAFLINNTLVHTSYTEPYTFWWHNAQTGNYTLVAIAYDDSLATGADTVLVNVIPSRTIYITGFTLINTNTNLPVSGFDPIPDSSVINRAVTGDNLNIRANVSQSVGCIRFDLNGVQRRIENQAPYAMTGDNSGIYNSWTPAVGAYIVKGHAYSLTNAQGSLLDTLSVRFTVINETPPSLRTALYRQLYPNPATSELTIHIDESEVIKEVHLITPVGRKYTPDLRQIHRNMVKVDTEQLYPGIYYIEIVTENGRKCTEAFRK